MTEENDWYYEPFSEEIWYENEWGDESFYGKGGKFNNRKSGKGKYSKGKGKFPFRKGYEVEHEGNKGLGKGKKGFGKSKMSGKEEAHVAGDMPAAEGAKQTADGATWNSSPHGNSYASYMRVIDGRYPLSWWLLPLVFPAQKGPRGSFFKSELCESHDTTHNQCFCDALKTANQQTYNTPQNKGASYLQCASMLCLQHVRKYGPTKENQCGLEHKTRKITSLCTLLRRTAFDFLLNNRNLPSQLRKRWS